MAAVAKGDSQVSHVARDLPRFPPTFVASSFIESRQSSWQVHLHRISPFLVAGVDVWWTRTPDGFLFNDGDSSPTTPEMRAFTLLHHRWNSFSDVRDRQDACWKRVIDEQILIPAHSIKLYDSDGNRSGTLTYSNDTVELHITYGGTTAGEVAVHGGGVLAGDDSPVGDGCSADDDFPSGDGISADDDVPGILARDKETVGTRDVPGDISGRNPDADGVNVRGAGEVAEDTSGRNPDADGVNVRGAGEVAEDTSGRNPDADGVNVRGAGEVAEDTSGRNPDADGVNVRGAGEVAEDTYGRNPDADGVNVRGAGEVAEDTSGRNPDADGVNVRGAGEVAEDTSGRNPDADGVNVRGAGEVAKDDKVTDAEASADTANVQSITSHINLGLEACDEGLKTSVGNIVKHLIGCDDDVLEFDSLRFKLKTVKQAGRRPNKERVLKYKQLSDKMKRRMSSFKAQREKELKEIEIEHLKEHGTLPSKISGSIYCITLKKRNLAMSVLRSM